MSLTTKSMSNPVISSDSPARISTGAVDAMMATLRFELLRGGRAVRLEKDSPAKRPWFSQADDLLSYAETGTATLFIDKRLKGIEVREGDCVFMPGETPRRSELSFASGKSIRRYIHFRFRVFEHVNLTSLFSIPTLFRGKTAEDLRRIVDHLILHESCSCAEALIREHARINGLGCDLLRILLNKASLRPQWSVLMNSRQRLAAAFDYIDANLSSTITLDSLAAACAMSGSTLNRMFRAASGLSPMNYVRSERVRQAQHMLLGTDMSVGEIATTLGYSDQFTFSKSFKKSCGISPDQYRHTTA